MLQKGELSKIYLKMFMIPLLYCFFPLVSRNIQDDDGEAEVNIFAVECLKHVMHLARDSRTR